MSTIADDALQAASWDLEPLVGGLGAEGVEEMLADARERAEAFAQRHRGAVAGLGAEGLAEAMHELAAIHDLAGRAGSYAVLRFSLDTADPERGALMQKAREQGAAIETALLFFELEWNLVPDERADELLAEADLEFCAHHLRTVRRYRPHQLSEPEERILTETSVNGPGAFARLFTEQTSALEIDLPGEPARRIAGAGALAPPGSRPRAARRGGQGSDRGPSPQPAHALVRVQHAARGQGRPRTGCAPTRTGSPRATWPTRPATNRWRRSSRPCARATTSRGAGTR